jgi:hypothetical protein
VEYPGMLAGWMVRRPILSNSVRHSEHAINYLPVFNNEAAEIVMTVWNPCSAFRTAPNKSRLQNRSPSHRPLGAARARHVSSGTCS